MTKTDQPLKFGRSDRERDENRTASKARRLLSGRMRWVSRKEGRIFYRWWGRVLNNKLVPTGDVILVFRACEIALDDSMIFDKHGPRAGRREPT